jgi:hypothetical protein
MPRRAERDQIDRRAQVGRKDGKIIGCGPCRPDRHGAEVGALMDDGKILSGLPEAWPVAAADIAGGRLSGGQSIAQRIATRVNIAQRLISPEM